MNAENFDIDALLRMAHSPVRNYVLPGMTSSLIGAPSAKGTVRLFQNEREHQETVTPHSHRFDFMCWVLRGSVRNRIWTTSHPSDREADDYRTTKLRYGGEIGKYTEEPGEMRRWRFADSVFTEGQCYSMRSHEVHSIYFSRRAIVLFFEGPTVSDSSIVIEPVVNGETIRTMEVKPWMFKREPYNVPHERANSVHGVSPLDAAG
jgi:hypothetical protein